MLILHSDWNRIRLNFTEAEKSQLRQAVIGEAICPPGFIVDEEKGGEALAKVMRIIETPSYREAYGK